MRQHGLKSPVFFDIAKYPKSPSVASAVTTVGGARSSPLPLSNRSHHTSPPTNSYGYRPENDHRAAHLFLRSRRISISSLKPQNPITTSAPLF